MCVCVCVYICVCIYVCVCLCVCCILIIYINKTILKYTNISLQNTTCITSHE